MGGCCSRTVDERLRSPIHARVIELLKARNARRDLSLKSLNQILLRGHKRLVQGIQDLEALFDSAKGPSGTATLSALVYSDLIEWGARNDAMVGACDAAGLAGDSQVDLATLVLLCVEMYLEEEADRAAGGGSPRDVGPPSACIPGPRLHTALAFAVEAFHFFDFFARGYITKKELFHALREVPSRAPPRRGSMEHALDREARASTVSLAGGTDARRTSASGGGGLGGTGRESLSGSFRMPHLSLPSTSERSAHGLSPDGLAKQGAWASSKAARSSAGVRRTPLVKVFETRFKELDDRRTGVITVDELTLHLYSWLRAEEQDGDDEDEEEDARGGRSRGRSGASQSQGAPSPGPVTPRRRRPSGAARSEGPARPAKGPSQSHALPVSSRVESVPSGRRQGRGR